MSVANKKRLAAVGRAFNVFGAAISASAAVEGGRRPARGDLLALGIDPNAFDRIG